MLSPEERRLILAILALLLTGALVKSCRSQVGVREVPKAALPTVPAEKTGFTRD